MFKFSKHWCEKTFTHNNFDLNSFDFDIKFFQAQVRQISHCTLLKSPCPDSVTFESFYFPCSTSNTCGSFRPIKILFFADMNFLNDAVNQKHFKNHIHIT